MIREIQAVVRGSAPVLLLFVAAAGTWACTAGKEGDRRATVETVELRLLDDGRDQAAPRIDPAHHEAVVVFRADRVEWRCACPEGTEFTVDRLHLVGDLEELDGPGTMETALPPGPCAELEEPDTRGPGEHPLFGDWTPPGRQDTWYPHDATIRSPPVVGGPVEHGLWKYTWKVRRVGDPDSAHCWDPHIFGHTALQRF